MNQRILMLFTILLSATYAHAEYPTLICIAEYGAKVTNENGVLGSKNFRIEGVRWLVTDKGVSRLGGKSPSLDKCHRSDTGRPFFCEHSESYAGIFLMDGDHVFRVSLSLDEHSTWVIGHCGEI